MIWVRGWEFRKASLQQQWEIPLGRSVASPNSSSHEVYIWPLAAVILFTSYQHYVNDNAIQRCSKASRALWHRTVLYHMKLLRLSNHCLRIHLLLPSSHFWKPKVKICFKPPLAPVKPQPYSTQVHLHQNNTPPRVRPGSKTQVPQISFASLNTTRVRKVDLLITPA